MIATDQFRAAMARLAASVNLITSDGPAGLHGMTASAVCSVTDTPPTLLVCINRASAANARFRGNGVLCVNVLAGRHTALSGDFANRERTMEQRFSDAAAWQVLETGAPVLRDASVALDCRIAEIAEVGTHSVFYCQVAAIHLGGEPEALVWFDRGYHALPMTA